jgi:1-acyl-sn-glycerol-3-phosphate acyltransferase
MIRTVLVHLSVLLVFMALAYPRIVLSIVDPSGDLGHWVARLWGRCVLVTSGVTVRVRGRENILKGRPQIFFSNHLSYFDVICLLSHLPAQYRWLAKAELFRIPLFGRAMAQGGYVAIDRSHPRKAHQSMLLAAERIRGGTSLVIFPEGTRSPDGKLQRFKTGGATLAIRAQVPVVPVVIVGTDKVLPKGSLRVRKGAVEIRIGSPIPTEGLRTRDRELLLSQVREAMSAMLDDLPSRMGEIGGAMRTGMLKKEVL